MYHETAKITAARGLSQDVFVKEHIKRLSKRSNARGFFAIFRDITAIAAIGYTSMRCDNILIYLASAWLIGAFQFAMSECLVHEAAHWNLFRSRR